MKEYIDASLFLGMHRFDEKTRILCKNFFVERLKSDKPLTINLEQVGKCDDDIWKFSREAQDAYYPFMDYLHTVLNIQRVPFSSCDIHEATTNKQLQNLIFSDRLTLGMVILKEGMLFTINTLLFEQKNLPVCYPKSNENNELFFPPVLEKLYQKSLKIKIGFRGIIPPLVTPIDKNGKVCRQSVKQLIEFVKPYSVALMPTLSSGEGWALSLSQFKDMIRYTISYSKLPVLAGVESKTTEEVVKRAIIAKMLGVDAIVITTPFSKDISQKEIYEHYKEVNDKIDIPIFIYNESGVSGCSISINTIKKISKLKNIIGIKEASGSIRFTQQLASSGIGIAVYQGWEHLCFQSKGVDGYILPLSNIEPKLCLDMFEEPTFDKQEAINLACEKFKITGNHWYVGLKEELNHRGIIKTDITI